MSELLHCIYTSTANTDLETAALAELLRRSRVKNEALGITGMLLYSSGSFMQVLEGDEPLVDALYARISADTRHHHVTLIIREPIPKRTFGEWSMGFFEAAPDEIADIDGFSFVSSASFGRLDRGRAKKLLQAFSEGRWRRVPNGSRNVASR